MKRSVKSIKRCTRCIIPDTKPGLTFTDGLCQACINSDIKDEIDWQKKEDELIKLLDQFRGFEHWDCIIPISGGKDSHFQAYTIKYKYKMNPLLVNFTPRDLTELGRKNLDNLYNLGFDIIEFKANPGIYRKLVIYGFEELGDPAFPEHLGIFAIPVRIAKAFGIKLVIWGENPYFEYGGNVDYKKDFWYDIEALYTYGFTLQDLEAYIINDTGLNKIYLGDYIKWDAQMQTWHMKQQGLSVYENPQPGNFEEYENLDTKYVNLHDYLKYLKYGYGRATDQLCIAIRQGRIKREFALALSQILDPQLNYEYLEEFKKEFGYSDERFAKICERFRIVKSD